jgi:hypothetical protein
MRKIGELETKKVHFVIYHDENRKVNPYRIYSKWYNNGWHKSLLEQYEDLFSCVLYIEDYVHRNYQ